ncbi:hypothetical protein NAEGRDRAFT_80403 [Naegleria gruberi]|uniref:Uncharacterized protein n=1 Tax=Naegleria gruberi TaxID=5762 RepID=D2VL32_NAEGR|nr:uncharacterized protein NAEGRDRAFT_80403 [Naegleria gruberi]EFC42552.1 hypothetical protein NAEGRDRAFT_80403 [Naegleria gruberi]|eukprot:XP_002675296.1 hypothetical protein NAEGRDRAFT_80403 [Naegleria gruberi strain NEG-M]
MQNQQHTGHNLYQHQQQIITNSPSPQSSNLPITNQITAVGVHNNNNTNMMMTVSTTNNNSVTSNNLYATTSSRPTTPSSLHHHQQQVVSSSWPMNFQQQHTFSNSNGNVVQQHHQPPPQQFRTVAQPQQQHGGSGYHIPQQQQQLGNNSVGFNTGNSNNHHQGLYNNQQQNMFNSLMQQQINTNMMNNNYPMSSNQSYNQLSSNFNNTNSNNNNMNNLNGSNYQVMMGNQSIDTSHHHVQNNSSNNLVSSDALIIQQNQTPLQHQLQNSSTPTPTRIVDGDNIFSVNSFFRLSNNDNGNAMKHAPNSTPLPSTTTAMQQSSNPSVGSRVLVQNSTSATPISFTTPTMVKAQNNTQPKWTIQQTTIVQPTLVKPETSPTNSQQQPTATAVDSQPNEEETGGDASQEAGQKGGIKITRNIRADTSVTPNEPVEYPKHGILYIYNVENWTDKNSFYDKIAYSFGTPSTQKKVHCSYLNCKVMHYERTCQGVYYCPHKDDDSESCIVRPCRLRFHTCQKHNNNSLTKSGKCPFKLHFYVPLDKADNRRLLLCLGTHNHPLLSESDGAIVASQTTEKKAKQSKSSSTVINLNQESKPTTPQNIQSSTGNTSTNVSSYQETKQPMSRVSSSNSVQSASKLKPNIPNMMPPSSVNVNDNILTSASHKVLNYNQNPNNYIMSSMPNTIPNNMPNNMNSMPSNMSSNISNGMNGMPNGIPNNITNMQNNMSSGMPPNMMNNIPNTIPNNMMGSNMPPSMSSNNNLMNIPQNLIGNIGNSNMNTNIHHGSLLTANNNSSLSNCYPSASDTLMNPPPKSTQSSSLHNMASLHRSASQEILTSSIASGTGLSPPAHHHSSPLGGRSPNLSPPYSYSSPNQYSSNKSNVPSYPQSQMPSIQSSTTTMNSIGSNSNISNTTTTPKKFTSLFQPSDYLQHVSKPPSYSKPTSTNTTLGESDPKRSSSLMSSSPNFMSSSSPSLYSFSNSPSPRIDRRSPSYHTNPTSPSPPHMLVSPMTGFPSLSPSYFYDNPSPSHSSPQQTIPQSPSQLIYKTDTSGGIKRERLYANDNTNIKKVKQEEDSVLPPIESIVD